MPPGSRKQRAIPKLVPAKAGTALEAATSRGGYIKLRRNDPALIRRELALNKCGTSNPRQCRGLTIWIAALASNFSLDLITTRLFG